MEHTHDYTLLRNRMTNGTAFLKAHAIARINALADNLTITQEEATELLALANQNGVDVLPTDALARLSAVEQETEDLTLMMADLIGGAV